MLKYITAGESHGKYLISVIEGVPAGLKLATAEIDAELARRQKGYGRGERMKIERDTVEFLSGVRWGETTGSPVSMLMKNRDWENWKTMMSADAKDRDEKFYVTSPRPGHADLSGVIKYSREDTRDIMERASARETAARVAAGAVCKKFISEFGIKVFSFVEEIGGVLAETSGMDITGNYSKIESSPVRCPDSVAEERMLEVIDAATEKGDTLGGIFRVVVSGVPAGLGSHTQWDRRIDGSIAGAFMSIQAVKGVEVGRGFEFARRFGSEVHDEIFYDAGKKKYYRKTNNAGGIEGGMTNGEDVVIRAVMKPIPSLKKPLRSVDIKTKEAVHAEIVRSDVCAVPSCSIIGESAAAYVIAGAFLEKYGGDSIKEIKERFL